VVEYLKSLKINFLDIFPLPKILTPYLGKDFIVKSSFGHVRDRTKKGISIDIENNLTPQYELSADKKAVVK
jgi:DNA topoisomerase-1